MITASDVALARYEQNRAAANNDRPNLISATVTVNLGGNIYTFPDVIGSSISSIEQTGKELAGGDQFGFCVDPH